MFFIDELRELHSNVVDIFSKDINMDVELCELNSNGYVNPNNNSCQSEHSSHKRSDDDNRGLKLNIDLLHVKES